MKTEKAHIIRTNGTEEDVIVPEGTDLAPMIGAEILCTVNLRDGRVMLVDDLGYETRAEPTPTGVKLIPIKSRKPVNAKATALYHSVCVPGTTHKIVGDVAIVRDE